MGYRAFGKEIKNSVAADYDKGLLTVDQIAAKYGVNRRTVYVWIKQADRRHNPKMKCSTLRLTKSEAEMLLSLFCKAAPYIAQEQIPMAEVLESRISDILDYLAELESL